MLFLIAQKIHTLKKNKPESAGEEGEKSNKYAFNLYKTFYTAKLHVHPYKIGMFYMACLILKWFFYFWDSVK